MATPPGTPAGWVLLVLSIQVFTRVCRAGSISAEAHTMVAAATTHCTVEAHTATAGTLGPGDGPSQTAVRMEGDSSSLFSPDLVRCRHT